MEIIALPKGKFDIIYADPPWDYKGQLQHTGKGGRDSGGAVRHYPTLTTKEMKRWNIRDIIADDSLLFMWSTSPHLDQAIELGKAWGFAWATVAFIWHKERVNPGYYTMSDSELCLVFKHGRIPKPRGKRNIRQTVVFSEKRQSHSAKPKSIRDSIEAMFPYHKKVELFAREQEKTLSNWEFWGNELCSIDSPI